MRCAVEIQRGMAERNADVQQERRIEFRIGLNIGDVIRDRGDIFGEGVNVAVRLEGIAQAPAFASRDAYWSVYKENLTSSLRTRGSRG